MARRRTGIVCPICFGPMEVRETIHAANFIRRRRWCAVLKCPGKLTTVEVVHSGAKLGDAVVIMPKADVERISQALAQALGEAWFKKTEDLDDADEPVSPSE